MTEDEREHLLSTVGQAHAGLSEVALKLRLGLPPKTPALKTAIKAERVAFDLKRSLQRLEVKDGETITRRAALLPEVRRGGKVVDPESLLRHENRHDERLTGLPRRNNRVYPGFPTLFWGLSGFFVNDLMAKALWKLVGNAQRFPRCGGRVLCVHGAVSFHRAHLYATRSARPRTAVDP